MGGRGGEGGWDDGDGEWGCQSVEMEEGRRVEAGVGQGSLAWTSEEGKLHCLFNRGRCLRRERPA